MVECAWRIEGCVCAWELLGFRVEGVRFGLRVDDVFTLRVVGLRIEG
jgi:hypothetical protein